MAFIVLFALLILSIFFSASETAYSALSRIRLKNMADKGQKGSRRAKMALALHDDFNRLLSTILVGNNIANLTAASVCAVLFVRRFGDIGATVSTAVLTVVLVVFADVTPKVLAKESPERVAIVLAPFLRFFVVLFTPFNAFFTVWKKFLSLIIKPSADKAFTEDELFTIVDEAKQEGVIDEDDRELLHNALEFNDQQVKDVLTPRMDVKGIAKGATPAEIAEKFKDTGLSRLPVYHESLDHILGVLHMRDFYNNSTGGQWNDGASLERIITKPIYVAPLTNLGDLIEKLKKEKSHMAIVSDEYGGTEGIVTMEDILEELVGEIWDESDKVIEKFVPLGSGEYRVLCNASMDDFWDYFEKHEMKDESEAPSVSGWIVDMLGKIPEEGDSFIHDDLKVTVQKTEQRRALECLVSTLVMVVD
ncbi:MAG: hemolysin family protein [Defluviitaleaceae bacterium]|nr:hemolysin family protein [Defluviitaleaceae bacterium]